MESKTNTINPRLIVEKADRKLWGRVKINGNLIVDSASSLGKLKRRLKKLIFNFEGLRVDNFVVVLA